MIFFMNQRNKFSVIIGFPGFQMMELSYRKSYINNISRAFKVRSKGKGLTRKEQGEGRFLPPSFEIELNY